MPVTNYFTIDGQMIGFKTVTGRKDFLTDSLGSVTAEVDQTGSTKTFEGRYKPYGGDLSSTGSRGNFGWVGSWGYRGTELSASSHYIRARHFSSLSCNWTSIDQFWPEEASYRYVDARATNVSDPSGMKPGLPFHDGRNYGCTSTPCCEYNTRYWLDQCKTTKNKFTCCASRVSRTICDSVEFFEKKCDCYPSPYLCVIAPALCDLERQLNKDNCRLGEAFDCQNSCMRWGHNVRRNPLWVRATFICKIFGESSTECCEASFRAEQKEYETCAETCLVGLAILPYFWRIRFGLDVLGCCK